MRVLLVSALLAFAGIAGAQPVLDWARATDGGGFYVDEAVAAGVDPAGNLVTAGTTHDGEAGCEAFVCKRSRLSAEIIWERRISAIDGNDMAVSDMAWDGQGAWLVAGYVVGCEG
jgi:hypothetical protein